MFGKVASAGHVTKNCSVCVAYGWTIKKTTGGSRWYFIFQCWAKVNAELGRQLQQETILAAGTGQCSLAKVHRAPEVAGHT